MKYRHVGLGTKLELDLFNEEGKKVPAIFVSQFGGYDEETNIMEIYAPIFQGNIYPVFPKMQMDVIFSKGKETFSFSAEAIERIYQGNIALLYIKPVSRIEKVERRSFFRMECHLEILYRTSLFLLPENEVHGDFISSKTLDISGGGICLITEDKLENGLYVEAVLKLKQKIRFVGTVARSYEAKNKGKIIYKTGIEFIRIKNKDREEIISYIFRTQRDLLKRGLIKNGE